MKVALGFKPHSGWAALVAIGAPEPGRLELVDRRRIELVAPGEEHWAKQPYHAAERTWRDEPSGREESRRIVSRGIQSARRLAVREVREAAKRVEASGHVVAACAVLMTDAMPSWSVDEILAVHFRMHKAEGVLFREALARAVQQCGLRLVTIPDKTLSAYAERVLGTAARRAHGQIAGLREVCGPPWGADQKDASLAACVALAELPR